MARSVTRAGRTVVLVPLALLPMAALPVALAAPALADDGSAKLVQTAWFWNRPTDAYPLGTPPVNPQSDPTVPDGGLPVADGPGDGSSSKESYLSFDLGAVPTGAHITKFTVTTQEVSANSAHAEAPKVLACLPPRTWAAGPAQSWAAKPFIDCGTGKVAGKYDSGSGKWTFEVTQFANAWLDGNTGLVLLNDPSYTAPYQLVFDSAKTTATVSYEAPVAAGAGSTTTTTPAAPSGVGGVPQAQPQPQPQAPALPASSGSLPSGFAAPAAIPAPLPAHPAPVAAPPAAATPAAAAAPAVAPAAVSEGVPLRHYGSGPGAGFYGVALLVLGLLVGASWALGGETPTTVSPASDSRLDRALQARRGRAPGVRPTVLRPA